MRCRFEWAPAPAWALRLLGVALGGLPVPVTAEDDWLSRSHAILDAAGQASRPAWLEGGPAAETARRDAAALLRSGGPPGLGAPGSEPGSTLPPDRPREFVLYVSMSLGESALKDLFDAAAGRDDLLLVFRGVRPGQRLPDFLRDLQPLLKGLDPRTPPRIVIDPTRFRAAGVSVVPTLTLEEHGRVRARVRGVTGVDWFRSRLDGMNTPDSVTACEVLDLGQQGPTRAIAEVDLLAEMQRRLAGIDWAAQKQAALARFWTRQAFQDLPEATAGRERSIDPTVTAPREVVGPDGTVLVRAGQRVNPLERLPFRQRLVVFDATRPPQVDLARRLGREAGDRRVVFLATRLDRQAGGDGLQALESALGAPVFLLTPELRARFGLEAVPAVIEAQDRVFRVREMPPGGGS
jgi:conjugal transfer pilus assembly protein TraW